MPLRSETADAETEIQLQREHRIRTCDLHFVIRAAAPAGLQGSSYLIISLGARLPQIRMNARRGNSGQLSLTTCLLNVLGCIARLFTTLVLTQASCNPLRMLLERAGTAAAGPEARWRVQDMLNFAGTALQTVLNGVLLAQTVRTARGRGGGGPVPAAKPA